MDPYRKVLLDAYAFMFSAKISYIHIGFNICLLGELKLLQGYMENETFPMDILGTMKDKAALRIHQFATESGELMEKLFEDNNLLDEEMMDYEYEGPPGCEGELDRPHLLGLLCLYTEREVSKITEFIDKLCYINNDPPLQNYADTSLYDDENIKIMAAFYTKAMELYNDILEKEIRRIV
jgi:hypothetical protein